MFRHPVSVPILIALVSIPLSACGSEATEPTPAESILTALPVDPAIVEWMAPFGMIERQGFHPGIDFGSSMGGSFRAAGTGRVVRVDLDTGQGLPGTNYQVMIEVGDLLVNYHFEVNGTLSEEVRRDNVLVDEGESVTAGQPIANLVAAGGMAHVHFGVTIDGEFVCPRDFYDAAAWAQLEGLYDSGVDRRPADRENLCMARVALPVKAW